MVGARLGKVGSFVADGIAQRADGIHHDLVDIAGLHEDLRLALVAHVAGGASDDHIARRQWQEVACERLASQRSDSKQTRLMIYTGLGSYEIPRHYLPQSIDSHPQQPQRPAQWCPLQCQPTSTPNNGCIIGG